MRENSIASALALALFLAWSGAVAGEEGSGAAPPKGVPDAAGATRPDGSPAPPAPGSPDLPPAPGPGAKPAEPAPPAPPEGEAPAGEEDPGDGTVRPPSPVAPVHGGNPAGILRISLWGGWVSETLRKDDEGVRGDRLSWENDLGGSPWTASARIGGEWKIYRGIYGTLDVSWFRRDARVLVPAGGIRFDGTTFPERRSLFTTDRQTWLDLGFLTWGTAEEDTRAGFAFGARFVSQQIVMSAGPRTRETNDSLYPYLEMRGEVALLGNLSLEGSARASLFTISYREVTEREDRVARYVDDGGGTVGERLLSSTRKRTLKTLYNALLEGRGALRYRFPDGTALFAGVGFRFHNAERIEGVWQEDLEWRSWTLEAGWELSF